MRVVNAAFQAPGAPLGAEKVNAELEIQKDRVTIQSFTAESGGGRITAQGFALYQPAIQFNVAVSGQNVRLRYPEGVRAMLKSDLALNGTLQSALLSGQVLIERLSLTESFDLASFAEQFSGPASPSNEGIAQNIKLDVALKSAQDMAISSSKLSVNGSADFRLRGTADEPVILGRANITGGEVFFNDRRYQVQNGAIEFINPVRTEPIVNLLVMTTVDQFNITLNFTGPSTGCGPITRRIRHSLPLISSTSWLPVALRRRRAPARRRRNRFWLDNWLARSAVVWESWRAFRHSQSIRRLEAARGIQAPGWRSNKGSQRICSLLLRPMSPPRRVISCRSSTRLIVDSH